MFEPAACLSAKRWWARGCFDVLDSCVWYLLNPLPRLGYLAAAMVLGWAAAAALGLTRSWAVGLLGPFAAGALILPAVYAVTTHWLLPTLLALPAYAALAVLTRTESHWPLRTVAIAATVVGLVAPLVAGNQRSERDAQQERVDSFTDRRSPCWCRRCPDST
ncbi:hypothetical protein [Asanoa sp. NPDC050611]|uniref:hypothetical protein n=1 Tax=Asanoa sp. NPDC050611 TaxID=3157098 RepID=UPI003403D4D4